jgi:mannitol-specific phosphotransferase system IIBC component
MSTIGKRVVPYIMPVSFIAMSVLALTGNSVAAYIVVGVAAVASTVFLIMRESRPERVEQFEQLDEGDESLRQEVAQYASMKGLNVMIQSSPTGFMEIVDVNDQGEYMSQSRVCDYIYAKDNEVGSQAYITSLSMMKGKIDDYVVKSKGSKEEAAYVAQSKNHRDEVRDES